MDVSKIVCTMRAKGHSVLADILEDRYKRKKKPSKTREEQLEESSQGTDNWEKMITEQFNKDFDDVLISLGDAGSAQEDNDSLEMTRVPSCDGTTVEVSKSKLLKSSSASSIDDHLFAGFSAPLIQKLQLLLLTNELELEASEIISFTQLCIALKLEAVCKEIPKALSESIPGREIPKVWSSWRGVPCLFEGIRLHLCEHIFAYAKCTEEFLHSCPTDLLLVVLQSDDLRILHEDDLVDLIKLILFQIKPENDVLKKILNCIRYPFLTTEKFHQLSALIPEVSVNSFYLLMATNKDWPSYLPAEMLRRRSYYTHHLHLLYHEDIMTGDEETFGVTCICGRNDESAQEILWAMNRSSLNGVVEARGRCAVLNNKALCLTDNDGQLWLLEIDPKSQEGLSHSKEIKLDNSVCEADLIDIVNNTEDGSVYVSWRDFEDSIVSLGRLQSGEKGYLFEKVQIPVTADSKRCVASKDRIVIMKNNELVVQDKTSTTTYASPARSASKFLDILVIGDKCFVYDFQCVGRASAGEREMSHLEEEEKREEEDGCYKDVLHIFHLDRRQWDSESWDIDLEATSFERRLYADAYNGISLFNYRDELWYLAEMTEDFGITCQVNRVNENEGFHENIVTLNAYGKGTSDDSVMVKEFLGAIPVDMNSCAYWTMYDEYCSTAVGEQAFKHRRQCQ